MKIIILSIAMTTILFSCKQTENKTNVSTVLYDSAYVPAVFEDGQRVEKIKAAFAVVDSLYKKHALANHFPAISFGVVVDGKLLYKNSYGYTDVAKKIPATSKT